MGFATGGWPGTFGAAPLAVAFVAGPFAVVAADTEVVVDVADGAGAFLQDAAAATSRSSQSACFMKGQCYQVRIPEQCVWQVS